MGVKNRDKTQPIFRGPYRVVEASDHHVYTIASLVDASEETKVVHSQFLRHYTDRTSLDVPPQLVAFAAQSTASGGNVVESIIQVDHRVAGGKYQFLVQWKGESASEASWESAPHMFSEVPAIVKRYVKYITSAKHRKVWWDLIQSWS